MSLFSRKPKSIYDYEQKIKKLNQKKRLSKRCKDKLQSYEEELASLKTAKEAEDRKKAKQKKIAIGATIGTIALVACIITAGVISEKQQEPSFDSPSYSLSESSIQPSDDGTESSASDINSTLPETTPSASTEISTEPAKEVETFALSSVPSYSGSPYVAINNNIPYFTEKDYTTSSYEYYSDLDSLGRCGVCVASVGKDLMPTTERGSIGSVKPTGWHTVKYDNVDGKYLYNRCHLIGYQLSGENANVKNLITGTRYLNIKGMLPFENMVADYVKETNNHVLYRATPIFEGDNLLANGVLLEGYSVEDNGDGICFNVFCYNFQPDININYANGESSSSTYQETTPSQQAVTNPPQSQNNVEHTYILNTNTKKFHLPSCSSVNQMKESNKQTYTGNRDDLISQGYDPCKKCNP